MNTFESVIPDEREIDSLQPALISLNAHLTSKLSEIYFVPCFNILRAIICMSGFFKATVHNKCAGNFY